MTKKNYWEDTPGTPPPPPRRGGITPFGGGRSARRAGPTDAPAYTLPTAPSWWQGITYQNLGSGEKGDSRRYIMAATALLPFMSPEDQRSMVSSIQSMTGTLSGKGTADQPFGDILGIPFDYAAGITPDMFSYYTSAARANEMLSALETMRMASKNTAAQMGPGYQYLTEIADAIRDFGGQPGDPMSRLDYQQFVSTLQPLLDRAQSDDSLSVYAGLARAIALPFLSAGPLFNVNQNGSFGIANARLYG